MSPQDFCFWFQGFVELTGGQTRPSETQWEAIKQHLSLVFDKQTMTMEQIEKLLETPVKLGPAFGLLDQPMPEVFIC